MVKKASNAMKGDAYLKYYFYFAGLFFCFSMVWGCATQRPAQNGSFKFPYDYESSAIHPEYIIYHFSDDSSRIYFRIPSADLLYTREQSSAPFEAKLKLNLEVYDSENGFQLKDSISFALVDYRGSEGPAFLVGNRSFKLGTGKYSLRLSLVDSKRDAQDEVFLTSDKSSSLCGQNFIISPFRDFLEPIFGQHCSAGDSLFIKSDRLSLLPNSAAKATNLKFLQFSSEVKLPPPPFSSNNPELPEMQTGIDVGIRRDSLQNWYVLPTKGFYFLTADTEEKLGQTVKLVKRGYPEVENFDQLIWPLRFITSKTEFEDISSKSFSKPYIDKFWIECAGSKDHARELIQTYYGRVQEANRFFSTYTEGWRTDRGMIHVIFGNPTKVNRNNGVETWIYGEEGTAASLQLTFRKIYHPLSDNVYQLTRDPLFKQYWEQMVTAWRQGRIYQD